MSDKPSHQDQSVSNWWKTDIIEMKPGIIKYRGHAIEDLIGKISFPQMIWLMTRGTLPSDKQAALLEAALVAAVDHGPQAPSIAITRMAATCGVGLNSAMASGLNVLGDVHGGAGEQAVELYHEIKSKLDEGQTLENATKETVDNFIKTKGKYLPGFGHRFHPVDPRAPRLLSLVKEAAKEDTVSGIFADIAEAVETDIKRRKGKKIPLNIDGATAVIYAELGFEPPLARGIFCLSRSVGLLAHAWEQTQQGGRNKGPMPKDYLWTYTGPTE